MSILLNTTASSSSYTAFFFENQYLVILLTLIAIVFMVLVILIIINAHKLNIENDRLANFKLSDMEDRARGYQDFTESHLYSND